MRAMPIIMYIMCELIGLLNLYQGLLFVQRNMLGGVQDRYIPLPVIMSNKQFNWNDHIRQLSIQIMRGDVSDVLLWF